MCRIILPWIKKSRLILWLYSTLWRTYRLSGFDVVERPLVAADGITVVVVGTGRVVSAGARTLHRQRNVRSGAEKRWALKSETTVTYYRLQLRWQAGNIFSRLKVILSRRVSCDHYPLSIGPHRTGTPNTPAPPSSPALALVLSWAC